MSCYVSVLATGSELLDGRVIDTNSNFVARELAELGLTLRRVLVVDDNLGEIVTGLQALSAVSDIVITSGGLGPTTDDLTRAAVAAFAGVSVVESTEARAQVEGFFKKRGREADGINLRQALLPEGAAIIINELGSAPGFMLQRPNEGVVSALSGVPAEFKQMFRSSVWPLIKARCGSVPTIQRACFKVFGLPESTIGQRIEALRLPIDVAVSYRAAFPEVQVVLKSQRPDLALFSEQVRRAITPACIFSEQMGESFLESLQHLLEKNGVTISTAESCTGGMLAELLTRTPGASKVYRGSIVAYNEEIKQEMLGVPSEVLQEHGAVSAETVRIMAQSVRERFRTGIGVAVSGVAGPTVGGDAMPVGTFFVGLSTPLGSTEVRCLYVNEREKVRVYASYVALDLIRRHLRGDAAPGTYPIKSA